MKDVLLQNDMQEEFKAYGNEMCDSIYKLAPNYRQLKKKLKYLYTQKQMEIFSI